MLTTTLAEIRSHEPCESRSVKIREHLGVSASDAETHSVPFPIATLLETNGLMDALWVFHKVAPQTAIDDFLIRRLDTGAHSALKTLRSLKGDWSRQIKAVEAIVALLLRRMAGENVAIEMAAARAAAYAAADAADAPDVVADAPVDAYAARAAVWAAANAPATRAATRAADAYVARVAAYADSHAARAAAYAVADAAAYADLLPVLDAHRE